jgi:hypothetical protein
MNLSTSLKTGTLLFGAALCGMAASTPASAQVPVGQVGVLGCNISPGVGFIITSNRALSCVYRPHHGHREYYAGTISRFGLAIGATGPGRLVWAVLSTNPRLGRYGLAGNYSGAGAALTFGERLGGNALVGGSGGSVALQPLSLVLQSGLDLSAGIGALTLEPVPRPLLTLGSTK